MFAWLRRSQPDEAVARIYEMIVAQARRPEFYADLEVADSLDGRFDMLALHAMLILRRFKSEPDRTAKIGQDLFDHMFFDMDRSLREVGVSDLSVGKRVKQMSSAFLGRIAAYEAGLADTGAGLEEALIRNVYRDSAPREESSRRLASYMRTQDELLRDMPLDLILAGENSFDGATP
jgi:cytochrome b pre-mRNA-processing protein 3